MSICSRTSVHEQKKHPDATIISMTLSQTARKLRFANVGVPPLPFRSPDLEHLREQADGECGSQMQRLRTALPPPIENAGSHSNLNPQSCVLRRRVLVIVATRRSQAAWPSASSHCMSQYRKELA